MAPNTCSVGKLVTRNGKHATISFTCWYILETHNAYVAFHQYGLLPSAYYSISSSNKCNTLTLPSNFQQTLESIFVLSFKQASHSISFYQLSSATTCVSFSHCFLVYTCGDMSQTKLPFIQHLPETAIRTSEYAASADTGVSTTALSQQRNVLFCYSK